MKLGLLWYDADKRVSPQQRLAEAATRFAERFGRPANCCHVNPEELFADAAITVRADASVLKHHFWVGRDEALEPVRSRRGRKTASAARPAAPAPTQPAPTQPARPTIEAPSAVAVLDAPVSAPTEDPAIGAAPIATRTARMD